MGINVLPEAVIQAISTHKPDVVGIAALLTTTIIQHAATTAEIKAKYPEAKIIVGGAHVTQKFADKNPNDEAATWKLNQARDGK